MTKEVADFTDNELWTLEQTLRERWGADSGIELQFADADVRVHPGDRETTECPAAIWQYQGCNYVIFKIGTKKYRCQFFYRGYQQYGTGIPEYDDMGDCVVSLLQVQADHYRENMMEKDENKGPPPGTAKA